MDLYTNRTLLLFLYVLCFQSGTDGLECYKCTSCDDPFDSNGVETADCGGSCTKGKTSQGIARYCLSMRVTGGCSRLTQDGVTIDACFCNEDFCNSGSVHRISVWTVTVSFTVTFIGRLFF